MTAALYIVIVAMLFQQAMSYMAAQVLPAVAPQVGQALTLDPGLVLYHTTLFYAFSGIFQASVGGLIIRWGAIRASQISLLGLGLGLALCMVGELWAFALAAIVMGASNSFSTPASSHLLARHSPPRQAPLIFSVKQTGVPVGGLIAAAAAALLVQENAPETWSNAFLATAIICLVLLVILHPMRRQFDADRNPGYPVHFSDAIRNVGMVVRTPALRELGFAFFAFVGLQGLFVSIFATYAQTDLGYDKSQALAVLLWVNLLSAGARVLWGWLGSSLIEARTVLGWLAAIMAGSIVAVGAAAGWPYWLLLSAALAFGASALSWHGLLLSEVARLAPGNMVGPVTGGILSLGALGMLSYPFIAKTLHDFGVAYGTIFYAASVPAALVCVLLLRPKRRAPAPVPAQPPAPRRTYAAADVADVEPLWARPPFLPASAAYAPGLAAALRGRRRRR